MTEAHKKRLCYLAGADYSEIEKCNREPTCKQCEMDLNHGSDVEILIKAMWAINRETLKTEKGYHVIMLGAAYFIGRIGETEMERIFFKDHNNSEQQALTAALIYVLDNEKKIPII